MLAMLLARDEPIGPAGVSDAERLKDKEILAMLSKKVEKDRNLILTAMKPGNEKMLEMLWPRLLKDQNIVLDSIKSGNAEILEMLLAKGAPYSDDLVIIAVQSGNKKGLALLLARDKPIPKEVFEKAIQKGDVEIFSMFLTHNAHVLYPKDWLRLIKPELARIRILFFSKDQVIKGLTNQSYANRFFMEMLDKNTQDFLKWIIDGAKMDGLSEADALRFGAVAFAMPAFVHEFKQLLEFFTKPDDFKIFTQEVIKKALITHNIEAFKLLLPKIGNNRDLVNVIRDELNDQMYQQKFVSELRALIKEETGRPQLLKSGKGDMGFRFN